MTAIMLRELRRLLPFSAVLLVATALAGVVDISVNHGRTDPYPVALWFGWFLVGLTAVGSGLLAQTGASPELRFLALWPVRRRALWLSRVPVHLLLAAVTGTGIVVTALTVASLGRHNYWHDPLRGTAADTFLAFVFPALLLLGFAVSVFWSQLVAAGWSALLTIFTVGSVVFLDFQFVNGLQDRLAPWLRLDAATSEHSPMVMAVSVLLPAALVLLAGGVLAARLPLLETRRRLGQGLLALPLAVLVAALLGLALFVDVRPVQPAGLQGVHLTPGGRYAAVEALSRTGGDDSGVAVWRVDTATGRSHLLCRHAQITEQRPGRWVPLWVYDRPWLGDLATGTLRRVRNLHGASAVSPGGRYRVESDGAPLIRGAGVEVHLSDYAQVVGWAPDDSAAYLLTALQPGPAGRLRLRFSRLALPAGTREVICETATAARPDFGATSAETSPDGRYLIVPPYRSGGAADARRERYPMQVIDTQTRTAREVPGAEVFEAVAGDGRYLWLRGKRGTTSPELMVVDVSRPGARPTPIGAGRLRGEHPGGACVSPDGTRVYFSSGARNGEQLRMRLWASDPSGSRLRDLGPAPEGTLVGVTASGALLDAAGPDLVAIDPQTGQRRVLMRFATTR